MTNPGAHPSLLSTHLASSFAFLHDTSLPCVAAFLKSRLMAEGKYSIGSAVESEEE
jgi:hypothetical protein